MDVPCSGPRSWIPSVVLSVVTSAVVALAGTPQAVAAQPEACASTEPSTPATPNSCSYVATVKGGIDAFRDWRVTILRGTGAATTVIIVESGSLPPQCFAQGPRGLCPIGIIQPGDLVSTTALSTGSFVGAGNPCPVPNPGVPPPILGGEC